MDDASSGPVKIMVPPSIYYYRRIRLTQVYTIYGISTKGVYPREFPLQIQEQ